MSKGEGGVYLYRLMETRGVLRTTVGMLKCSVETEEMAERSMHINPEEVKDGLSVKTIPSYKRNL